MHRRSLIGAALAAIMLLALASPLGAGAQQLPPGLDLRNADRCEFIAAGPCMLPFPSDRFTVRDGRTPTGRRVAFSRASMPANRDGVRIDPAEWNRNDGFSPGQTIIVKVPRLDTAAALRRTGAVTLDDLSQYSRRDQPVVLIDARSGRRHPIWAELDDRATSARTRSLLIHPASNLREGRRYVVALRDLRDVRGRRLPAPAGFRLYRDGIATRVGAVERRRGHFRSIFRTLGRAGIARGGLYLAWDFTVASRRTLSGRMLRIRDDAFRQLGDRNLADLKVAGAAPRHTIDRVTDFTRGENAQIAREVAGTVEVPCYLASTGCARGAAFNYSGGGPDALPTQRPGNVQRARFLCVIPRSSGIAGETARPARPSLYGHGSFGSERAVRDGDVTAMAQEHDIVFCATPQIGFADEDVPDSYGMLNDFSDFDRFADRIQQGLLNELILGRLMIHPRGLAADRAFQTAGGSSVIDTTRLFYDGNSMGGILGGALTAFAPDFDRAVLGVGAMTHSAMLPRSLDWPGYFETFGPAYPSQLARPLVLSLAQMLWDRAEPNGVAQHMTSDPLPNTPPHKVLMQIALGDFQVSDTFSQVQARTIGAAVRAPIADRGRLFGSSPYWGIEPISVFPYDGTALTVWDAGPIRDGGALGNNPSPLANLSPVPAIRGGALGDGADPHGLVRWTPAAREQKSRFLRVDGVVVDTCGPTPCYVSGWDGPR